MQWQRIVTVLASGALVVSACSGSDGTEAASSSSDAEESENVEVTYESPLGDFLGWTQGADFDEEAAQAEWAEKEREAQEAIALCMTEQGFEYIPVDTSAQQVSFGEEFDGLEWGTEEWTEKYGFGITTLRFSQDKVGPDLVGHTWNDFGPGAEGPTDPNQAYLETLSESEVNAYYEALYGGDDAFPVPIWEEEGREPTEEEMIAFDEEWQENYVPTGCEPVAFEEIYNDGPGQEEWESFDTEFGEALQEMEERMDSHPDVVAYRDGVRACVEERGVEFLTEEDAYGYFEDKMNAAGLGWEAEGDPFADLDTSELTDEDFDRIYQEFERQPMAPEKLTALAELQIEEVAMAIGVRECGGGWQQEQNALQSVRIELEEEFLEANADRLAEYEGVFGN